MSQMDNSQTVSVDRLADFVAELKATIGSELCDRLIDGYSSRDGKGFMDHHRREARAHPFALGWDDLASGTHESTKAGVFRLSDRAFFLLDSMYALTVVKQDPNHALLFEKLANGPQYLSTVFEAVSYAIYKSKGYAISIVEESTNHGERRPDLVVTFEGVSIFLECKGLEDKYQQEDRVWSTIEDRVCQILARNGAGYRLKLVASRPLKGKDVEPIVGALRKLASRFPSESIANTDSCELTLKRISGPGEVLELQHSLQRRSEGRVRFEMGWVDKSGADLEFTLLESFPFFDHRQGDALIRLLKGAADQLPGGTPGVIHLQVPYRVSKLFLDVVDYARPLIEREIKKRPHVCAVVLIGRFLNQREIVAGDPIITHLAVVPNFSAKFRLPANFRLPGACGLNEFLQRSGSATVFDQADDSFSLGSVGTFCFSFGIYEPLSSQKGLYLCRYSSNDGWEQLNIWQTYRSVFRIEIVEKGIGRLTLDFDLNHLAIGVTHHMAFAWNEDGIRCAVDGEMVSV